MSLGQVENIILQSYLTVALLIELNNNRFLDSDYFEKMNFGNPSLKPLLQQVGVDNQGSLLMVLYAMLCLPKEKIFDVYKAAFNGIDTEIAKRATTTKTSYQKDSPHVNYARHIRNAVAHGNVEFSGSAVIFSDKDEKKGEYFTTEIPLDQIGTILMELQKLTNKYVDDINNRS